mgnify:CR=1 FL=1|jgi:predicted Fe-S protein YdhL (DUF1289 family)
MSVQSPCKGICNLDFATHTVCQGCGRNVDDIKNWRIYTDEQKQTAVIEAKNRLIEIGYESMDRRR